MELRTIEQHLRMEYYLDVVTSTMNEDERETIRNIDRTTKEEIWKDSETEEEYIKRLERYAKEHVSYLCS